MTKSTSLPKTPTDLPSDLHVVPLNDMRDHFTSCTCWCKPVLDEEDGRIWVHNPLDGRTEWERDPAQVLH